MNKYCRMGLYRPSLILPWPVTSDEIEPTSRYTILWMSHTTKHKLLGCLAEVFTIYCIWVLKTVHENMISAPLFPCNADKIRWKQCILCQQTQGAAVPVWCHDDSDRSSLKSSEQWKKTSNVYSVLGSEICKSAITQLLWQVNILSL